MQSKRTFLFTAIAVVVMSLNCSMAFATVLLNEDFESPINSRVTVNGSGSGTATVVANPTTGVGNNSSKVVEFLPRQGTNPSGFDASTVLIDLSGLNLKLKDASATFDAYQAADRFRFPFIYFSVDTNNDAATDSFVLPWTTADATYGASRPIGSWYTDGIDRTSEIHVSGARPGLGTNFNNISDQQTLDDLITNFGWGNYTVLEAKLRWPDYASNGTGPYYVDNVQVISAVPGPSAVWLALVGYGLLGLGVVTYHRRRDAA